MQTILPSQKSYGVSVVITSAYGEGYIFGLFVYLSAKRMNRFPWHLKRRPEIIQERLGTLFVVIPDYHLDTGCFSIFHWRIVFGDSYLLATLQKKCMDRFIVLIGIGPKWNNKKRIGWFCGCFVSQSGCKKKKLWVECVYVSDITGKKIMDGFSWYCQESKGLPRYKTL